MSGHAQTLYLRSKNSQAGKLDSAMTGKLVWLCGRCVLNRTVRRLLAVCSQRENSNVRFARDPENFARIQQTAIH